MSTRTERWNEVADLFDELVEQAPAQRAQRLAEVARTDAALAAEVEALLAADESGVAVLDSGVSPAVPEILANAADNRPSDARAGPYRLLRQLGEGGMGVVWLAERTDGAYEQQVAVKLLKRGMDTHAILRRFLQERRILARLHHAHIVRLLDGGMSVDGRPFYVMEYVHGEPITERAARERLDPSARVALLAKVADAVAYAHAQLVVHRDIKPSNVLVDAAGEPRVLDFGIAKLIEESGEQTLTGTGQRVMSPAYAAPEQVLGEAIGTATDVYALGLLLCELLVGELPHQRVTNSARLALDADVEAARASSLAARLPADRVHALYGDAHDPARLSRRLAGDLDVIIATAVQREPARRYPTVAAFARDLRHWLDGLPISARADSGWYRVRRFASRHRFGVAAGVLVALSLVGGFGAAVWQARVARAEAQRADAARAQAEHQLARSERVKQFILTLFREQDPVARAKAQARTPAELVRAGIAEVDASLGAQPDLQAELLRDLGEIQVGVDEPARATETLRRAWEMQKRLSGDSSSASADAYAAYADAVYTAGDAAVAAPLLQEAVQRLHAAGLGERPRTAQAEATLALVELIGARNDEAERLARHALAVDRKAFGADSMQAAMRLATLGKVQQETARYGDALASYREALAIIVARGGEDHARGTLLQTSIGDVLRVQRRYAEALPAYEASLRIARRQLPAGHRLIGATLIRLGDLQRRMRRFDEADASLTEAIAILSVSKGGQYAQALQFHAGIARGRGQFDLAAERYGAAFEAFRASTGDSVYTWLTALVRVQALVDAGRLGDADALAREAGTAFARMPEDPYAKVYQANVMGLVRHEQGRFAEAIEQRRSALQGLLAMYAADHAEVLDARVSLASSLVATGGVAERAEASRLVDEAGSLLSAKDDPDASAMYGNALLERSRIRLAEGNASAARADLDEALDRLGQRPEDARRLREARAFARTLGVDDA